MITIPTLKVVYNKEKDGSWSAELAGTISKSFEAGPYATVRVAVQRYLAGLGVDPDGCDEVWITR